MAKYCSPESGTPPNENNKVVPIAPEQCMKTYVQERSVITSLAFVTWFNDCEGDFLQYRRCIGIYWSLDNLSDQGVLPTDRLLIP
jgi:hypothetical protein